MSRELHRERCPRCLNRQRPHTLARVCVEGDRVVVVREMAVTPKGVVFGWRTIEPAELADQVAHGVSVTCPCGQHYHLDVARLFRGEPAEPVPSKKKQIPGVSYKRRRAEDR